MRHLVLLFTTVVVLVVQTVQSDTECFRYSKKQFTVIVECDNGCTYRFKEKNDGLSVRIDGGCAKSGSKESGCFTGKDRVTRCSCSGDRCNLKGYEMPEDD